MRPRTLTFAEAYNLAWLDGLNRRPQPAPPALTLPPRPDDTGQPPSAPPPATDGES